MIHQLPSCWYRASATPKAAGFFRTRCFQGSTNRVIWAFRKHCFTFNHSYWFMPCFIGHNHPRNLRHWNKLRWPVGTGIHLWEQRLGTENGCPFWFQWTSRTGAVTLVGRPSRAIQSNSPASYLHSCKPSKPLGKQYVCPPESNVVLKQAGPKDWDRTDTIEVTTALSSP